MDQMRGGVFFISHIPLRQEAHTARNNVCVGSTKGDKARITTTRGWGEVAPANTPLESLLNTPRASERAKSLFGLDISVPVAKIKVEVQRWLASPSGPDIKRWSLASSKPRSNQIFLISICCCSWPCSNGKEAVGRPKAVISQAINSPPASMSKHTLFRPWQLL